MWKTYGLLSQKKKKEEEEEEEEKERICQEI